jgi:hypothetical protein
VAPQGGRATVHQQQHFNGLGRLMATAFAASFPFYVVFVKIRILMRMLLVHWCHCRGDKKMLLVIKVLGNDSNEDKLLNSTMVHNNHVLHSVHISEMNRVRVTFAVAPIVFVTSGLLLFQDSRLPTFSFLQEPSFSINS